MAVLKGCLASGLLEQRILQDIDRQPGIRGVEAAPAGTRASVSAGSAQLHDRRPATPQSIAALRRAVIHLAVRGGATERQCQDIALAVSEALTNAVIHAYAKQPRPGVVAVHAALDGDALDVVVLDKGVGMPPPTSHPATGLGLAIIARVTERLELSDAAPGTRVRMTFAIG
jgi:anti-sigma regulatory factor (Ser/Thr protein kinase)